MNLSKDLILRSYPEPRLAQNPWRAQGNLLRAARNDSVRFDANYVQKHIGDLAKNADLSRFIL